MKGDTQKQLQNVLGCVYQSRFDGIKAGNWNGCQLQKVVTLMIRLIARKNFVAVT